MDVWDRQKKWEIKRDAFFEAVKELATVEIALVGLALAYEAPRHHHPENPSMWATESELSDTNRRLIAEAKDRLNEVSPSFQKVYELATLVRKRSLPSGPYVDTPNSH